MMYPVSMAASPTPPNTRAADNPWPQFPRLFKVDYGHEEVKVKWGGDPRRYNTMSKRFIGDEKGRVSGVETVMVEWSKDEKGAWKMCEVAGSEKTYPCQMVLLAMGFLGPEQYVVKDAALETDNRCEYYSNTQNTLTYRIEDPGRKLIGFF